jgi:hypothetical protein
LLGASAAVVLYVAGVYLMNSPNTVVYNDRTLGAGELSAAILAEARLLDERMQVVDMPSPTVPRYHERFEALCASDVLGTDAGPRVSPVSLELRRAARFGPSLDVPIAWYPPVRILKPGPPVELTLSTGWSVLATELADTQQAPRDTADGSEVTWVRIAACFDHRQERQAWAAAGYPPYALNAYVAGVDAQRQELLADGGFSQWQDVESPCASPTQRIAQPCFDDRDGRLLNREALSAACREVRASQTLLTQPTLGPIVSGDLPRPVGRPNISDAGDNTDDSARLWLYDQHAEPGRVYRYRVRVWLWNHFVGRPQAVHNPADAQDAVVAGTWSQPSGLITAAPQTHFFVLGPSVRGNGATIEVWNRHAGRWLRRSFTAAAGDVIGGVATVKTGELGPAGRPIRERIDFDTGVVVLDLRREARSLPVVSGKDRRFVSPRKPTLVLVGLDSTSGRVIQRSQLADRADPLRKRLWGRVAKRAIPDDVPTDKQLDRPRPDHRPAP